MTVGFNNSQAPYIYTDNSVSLDRSVPSITVQLPSDDLNGIIRRAPLKGADIDLIIPGYDLYNSNNINDDEFTDDTSDNENESYLNVNDFHTNSQNPLVQFNSKLTKFGGILKLNSASTIIDKVSYRILNDNKTIILTPLIMSNRLGLNFRSVNLILPNNIKNKCIRIIKNDKNKNDSNDYFLIDLLTDLDIFISIKFKLSWFLENHDGDFHSLNFYNWCNYSAPYSFSTRPPLYLYSIDELNCLLVLKDGGILKLERKETLHGEIQVIPFSDSSYIESFRSKLFSSVLNRLGNSKSNTDNNDNNENEIPSYIIEDKDDKNSNRISTRAIISISYLKEFKILITLSIDKKLKFWSLSHKKIIQEIDLNNYLPQELWKTIISKPITFELMNLIKNEINNEYYLSLLLPIGEIYLKFFKIDISILNNENNENNEEDSIDINLFEINDLNKNFQICIPNDKQWLFHSYKIKFDKIQQKFKIWVMWFYNTSKFIQNYVIDLKTNEFKLFKIINNDEINFYNLQNTIIEFLRVNNNKDKINEFFINLILNGFNYNELIITTVIKSFNLLENNENSKSLVKLSDKDEDKGSIKDQILKLINKNLDNNNDINFVNGLKDHWLKFQNSCEDLRKQCQDPISLMINDNDEEFIIIIKNYEYSIIKNVSIHEIINYNNEIKITNEIFDEISYLNKYSNKQINEINSLNLLIKLIKNFKKIFSNNEIFKIENLINENLYDLNNIEISNNLMNLLYDEIISGKLNNLITEQLINELNNIPDIMNTIDNLISISYNKDEFFFNNLEFEKNFGNLSNSILLILVKNEILIEFNIIIGLILIIITVDRNELMNKLFLKLINKVKYYNLNLKLFEIGFKDSSNNGLLIIEKDNCFNIENCLFNKIIKLILFKDNKLGIKINQKNINDLVYYLIEFSTNEFFIISILSNLISINQESLIIDKKFNSIINPNDADENIDKDTRSIFQLINGIILMKLDKVEESFKVFVDNSHNIIEFFKDEYENNGGRKDTNTIIKRNKLLISLIPINSIINKFNDVNLIEYYMNLSLIFEKLNFNLVSLKFQIESMKIFNQFKQGLIKINSIEANEIDKIEINQQVNCFKLSIKVDNFELSYNTILNINNKSNEDIQFNCIKIFINKLFEKNLIKELIINYRFKDLIDKIDLILVEIIRKEENLNFINSLKFYKILHSWRFKNGLIREACEILYEFNLKLIKSQEENSNNKKLIKLTGGGKGGSAIDDEVSGLKDKQLILVENYLVIINLLSTIKDEEDRYIIIKNGIINGDDEGAGAGEGEGEDSIVWINKIKEEYQSVLNDMRIMLELNN